MRPVLYLTNIQVKGPRGASAAAAPAARFRSRVPQLHSAMERGASRGVAAAAAPIAPAAVDMEGSAEGLELVGCARLAAAVVSGSLAAVSSRFVLNPIAIVTLGGLLRGRQTTFDRNYFL